MRPTPTSQENANGLQPHHGHRSRDADVIRDQGGSEPEITLPETCLVTHSVLQTRMLLQPPPLQPNEPKTTNTCLVMQPLLTAQLPLLTLEGWQLLLLLVLTAQLPLLTLEGWQLLLLLALVDHQLPRTHLDLEKHATQEELRATQITYQLGKVSTSTKQLLDFLLDQQPRVDVSFSAYICDGGTPQLQTWPAHSPWPERLNERPTCFTTWSTHVPAAENG